jgi:hypothetical protein
VVKIHLFHWRFTCVTLFALSYQSLSGEILFMIVQRLVGALWTIRTGSLSFIKELTFTTSSARNCGICWELRWCSIVLITKWRLEPIILDSPRLFILTFTIGSLDVTLSAWSHLLTRWAANWPRERVISALTFLALWTLRRWVHVLVGLTQWTSGWPCLGESTLTALALFGWIL